MTNTQTKSLYKNARIDNSRDIYYFGDITVLNSITYKIHHNIHSEFREVASEFDYATFFVFNKRTDLLDCITKF